MNIVSAQLARPIEAKISPSYARIYVLFFGRDALARTGLVPGRVSVLLKDDPGFPAAEGTLRANGALSGMARVYARLGLKAGDSVAAEIHIPDQITILTVSRTTLDQQVEVVEVEQVLEPEPPLDTGVFSRRRLRHRHIEVFSAENLKRWSPETETDVYLAFGVLQDYTQYRYCCGTSAALLKRLGYTFDAKAGKSKPDAVLISEETEEYVLGEFKMHSSDFAGNHDADDVDLLIVWEDDEKDRSLLPKVTLPLREIARIAAEEAISA